ncbi:TIGR02391 family protein [Mycolicibacterium baixiangningiae]|uniref:TIGR02391 family protein n=1 Tax=Mycolicibacterium baixiangningiae TaxID=2761578 RepID=UPI001868E422|nr:TIGR02391 family protein [Mycolicibacterium baixiangningiae]
MLPHGIPGKTMKLRRVAGDGTVTEFDIQAQDLGHEHGITFAVDADVEDGDEVTDTLPNGKTKTMKLREVQVREMPFPGASKNLDHTGAKYEVVSGSTVLRQPMPVSLPGLHPLISAASGSQIASRHYGDAVFNACKAVEDRAQALTGYPKNAKGVALSGKGLMGKIFDEQAALLDITSDGASEAQKADEREGFKYLFMGVAQVLRNPRGHGPNLQITEHEAMEMLATTSMLMRSLDRAELRKAGQEQRLMRGDLKSPIPPGLTSYGRRRLK